MGQVGRGGNFELGYKLQGRASGELGVLRKNKLPKL